MSPCYNLLYSTPHPLTPLQYGCLPSKQAQGGPPAGLRGPTHGYFSQGGGAKWVLQIFYSNQFNLGGPPGDHLVETALAKKSLTHQGSIDKNSMGVPQ